MKVQKKTSSCTTVGMYQDIDRSRKKERGDRKEAGDEKNSGHKHKLTVLQLSWLERYTDNVEVGSSTLPGTTEKL